MDIEVYKQERAKREKEKAAQYTAYYEQTILFPKAQQVSGQADTLLREYAAKVEEMANTYQDPASVSAYREKIMPEIEPIKAELPLLEKASRRIQDDQARRTYQDGLAQLRTYLENIPKDLDAIEAHWKQWDSQQEYDAWKKAADAQDRLEEMQKQRDAAVKRGQLGVGEGLDYVVPTDEEYRAAAAQAQEAAKAAQPSAEKLRKMIAEREEELLAEKNKELEQTPEEKQNWFQKLFSGLTTDSYRPKVLATSAAKEEQHKNIREMENQITAYKQQLYYTENEETFANLPQDLQEKVMEYVSRQAASEWVAKNEGDKTEEKNRSNDWAVQETEGQFRKQYPKIYEDQLYRLKDGKLYYPQEIRELADGLTWSYERKLKKELREAGTDPYAVLEYALFRNRQEYVQKENEEFRLMTQQYPILSNLASILATVTKPLGIADTALTALGNVFTGREKPVDIGKDVYWGSRLQAAVREQTAEDIASYTGMEWTSLLYQAGMSTLDSLSLTPLSFIPGGKAASLGILGGGAATDTAIDITNRGGTASQAFWGGLITGAAEAVFEKFSLDELLKPAKFRNAWDLVCNFFRGFGVGAGEELATGLVNILADQAVMGDRSHYASLMRQYEETEGMSPKQASQAAMKELAKQIGMEAAVGGLFGGAANVVKGGIGASRGQNPTGLEGLDGSANRVDTGVPGMGDPDAFSSFLAGMEGRGAPSDSSLPNGADGGRIELEGGRTYGLQETEELRGDGSGVYGQAGWRGSAGEAADRGTDREVGGMETDVPEYDPGRTDRVASADEGEGSRTSGRRLSYLDHHGQSSIAYEPVKKRLPDSPAGRAAQLLQDSGIRVVVTDGAFETRRDGRATPHTEAVTAPDGTVYVSSVAQIPAERIAAHESVHVLQNQNSPLYQAYWEELQFQLDIQSKAYRDVSGTINDEHYRGRIDLDDPGNIEFISWELTAHLHEWLQTDPAFAREIFGDLFFDWDAVVRADRALTQGMKASAQGGAANILGKTGEENSDELFSSFLSGMEGRGPEKLVDSTSSSPFESIDFTSEISDDIMKAWIIRRDPSYTEPQPGTLDNVEARKWYLDQEAKILERVDSRASIEEQAKQSFAMRNYFRTKTRELMADRVLAKQLFETEPNLTWEQIVERQMQKGYSGEAVFRAILASARRSRRSVNRALGLDQPDTQESR